VAVGEEEAHTVGEEDALFHGETLLVVTAGDAEDISFPFVAEGVTGDFLSDFFVEEDAAEWGGEDVGLMGGCKKDVQAFFVVEVDELLGPSGGVW